MRTKCQRVSLNVEAVKYELGKGLEDGFKPFAEVVTHGFIVSEGLIKLTNEQGVVVCPFIKNRRGIIFIREGDYIIYEESGQRHCCGSDKFAERFREV